MNNDLIDALKVSLADSYAFSLKAQNYHWNVESTSFSEHHEFFGSLYTEVQAGLDGIAESIRTLDAYAPGSFIRFKDLTSIQDETNIPPAISMFSRLSEDNQKVLDSLVKAYEIAEKDKKYGISNFIQDRITAHEKHGWMLRSYVKA